MFSSLHLPLSFYPRLFKIISLSLLYFSHMFATPALVPISSILISSSLFIPINHLNSLISVDPSKFCSAFLSAYVSLPYEHLLVQILVCIPRLLFSLHLLWIPSSIIMLPAIPPYQKHRCQHQRTKKRDRADEKAGVSIFFHHQGAQLVLQYIV